MLTNQIYQSMKSTFFAIVLLLGLSTVMVSCDKEDFGSGSSKASGKENGHEYVDLGLPSGTLWATYNVGATSPMEYGGYYAWGETGTKRVYSWETYKWLGGFMYPTNNPVLSKYRSSSQGWGDDVKLDYKTILDATDDAAQINWGGKWRMPTIEEWRELVNTNYCTLTPTPQNGGIKVTSRKNGKSIFLPAAGCLVNYDKRGLELSGYGLYWASNKNGSPNDESASFMAFYGYRLSSGHDIVDVWSNDYKLRRYGLSVRPVFTK